MRGAQAHGFHVMMAELNRVSTSAHTAYPKVSPAPDACCANSVGCMETFVRTAAAGSFESVAPRMMMALWQVEELTPWLYLPQHSQASFNMFSSHAALYTHALPARDSQQLQPLLLQL